MLNDGWSDQLHVRPTGMNDRHSGERWMNGADKLLAHLILFESPNFTVKTRRSEEWVQETHTYSSTDIKMDLKIDQVTGKFAITSRAKVSAPSALAIVSSTEAKEQTVRQLDKLTSTDMVFSKSKPLCGLLWSTSTISVPFFLSPSHSLSRSLLNFSHLLSYYPISRMSKKCHKIQVWMLMCSENYIFNAAIICFKPNYSNLCLEPVLHKDILLLSYISEYAAW